MMIMSTMNTEAADNANSQGEEAIATEDDDDVAAK